MQLHMHCICGLHMHYIKYIQYADSVTSDTSSTLAVHSHYRFLCKVILVWIERVHFDIRGTIVLITKKYASPIPVASLSLTPPYWSLKTETIMGVRAGTRSITRDCICNICNCICNAYSACIFFNMQHI